MDNKKLFTSEFIVSSNRVLYTPSVFARSSLLHLQEIGTLTALAPHVSRRSGLQSYLFFTVLSGAGTLTYDGKEYGLLPADCVFVDCQRQYSHATEDDLWSLRWCHFYGPTLSLVYKKYIRRGGRPTFRPESVRPYLDRLDRLQELATDGDYIRDMRINEELSGLCTLLMEQSWHPEVAITTPKRINVAEVRGYLERHCDERITLDKLASRFYINKYYLTRLFKEQYGMSITTYLTSLRVTHAKQLLRFTDKTVEEVGMECGLGHASYFSRVFKQVEGVPPSVYRSQW